MNNTALLPAAERSPGRGARRWAPVLMLLPLLSVGCEPQHHATPHVEVELGPVERLDLVLERFRSRCTTTDTTLSIPDEGVRRQRMRVKVEFDNVTHQLHTPTTPDGKYTAEVTVQSSTYLSVLTPPKADSTAPEKEAPLPEDDLDPLATADQKRRKREQQEHKSHEDPENIARREHNTATYDLAYEQDRWVLKSQNVDPSIQLMFDYALAVQ